MITLMPTLAAGELLSFSVEGDGKLLLERGGLRLPDVSGGDGSSLSEGNEELRQSFGLPVDGGDVDLTGVGILRITGELTGTARAGSFSTSNPLIDLARFTRVLHDTDLAPVERIRSFGEVRKQAAKQYGEDLWGDLNIVSVPHADKSIREFESRFGVELPDAMRDFFSFSITLTGDGHIISDSVFRQVSDWKSIPLGEYLGYDDEVEVQSFLDDLDPEVALLYRSGVEIMGEASDGIGGIAWTPDGTLFSYHQEDLSYIQILHSTNSPGALDEALVGLGMRIGLDDFLSMLIEEGHLVPVNHGGAGQPEDEVLTIDTSDPRGAMSLDFYMMQDGSGLSAYARSSWLL